ncbi:hypothetical protein BaRGS_00019871, partial [Batillaria attramentaria]
MTLRNFRGIPSLKEVECSGEKLRPELKVVSLRLFKLPGQSLLAYIDHLDNECSTYGEFASCVIDKSDRRKSRLRTLVSDLQEGESRVYGCNATTTNPFGEVHVSTWSILVLLE